MISTLFHFEYWAANNKNPLSGWPDNGFLFNHFLNYPIIRPGGIPLGLEELLLQVVPLLTSR